jgi:hypothetical protein
MKTFLLVLLFAATACAAPMRDGAFWEQLTPWAQTMWATGWMDGVSTGEGLVSSQQYTGQLNKWGVLNSSELTRGITQFYDADYRNLKISMAETALLIVRYSREGMTSREATAQIAILRDKYAGVIDSH